MPHRTGEPVWVGVHPQGLARVAAVVFGTPLLLLICVVVAAQSSHVLPAALFSAAVVGTAIAFRQPLTTLTENWLSIRTLPRRDTTLPGSGNPWDSQPERAGAP